MKPFHGSHLGEGLGSGFTGLTENPGSVNHEIADDEDRILHIPSSCQLQGVAPCQAQILRHDKAKLTPFRLLSLR